MSSKIRVLDISKIGLDRSEDAISASDWREVGADLRESFTGSGFAYLVGHGLPSKVRREAFGVSRRFFEELTTEEKQKAFPRWKRIIFTHKGCAFFLFYFFHQGSHHHPGIRAGEPREAGQAQVGGRGTSEEKNMFPHFSLE